VLPVYALGYHSNWPMSLEDVIPLI